MQFGHDNRAPGAERHELADTPPGVDTPALADDHAVRRGLAREIARIVNDRGLTQAEAADILGTAQPRVSAILAGKVDGFSVERLMRFLNALDQDVHLVVLPKATAEDRAVVRVSNVPPFILGLANPLGAAHG